MKKRDKIIYWVSTLWLALGMTSTGIVQLLRVDEEVAMMTGLGVPLYFMTILGVWKILGVIAILVPRFALLKEWAYAGFFFNMSGALVAHFASHSSPKELFGPSLLIVLTVISWYFRPAERRIISNNIATVKA